MGVSERLRALFGKSDVYYLNFQNNNIIPAIEGMSARRLYATQANLHAVISFLADSVAQLPLKVYVRDGENQRRRDRSSQVAQLLWQPNADQTAYEFINSVMVEYLLMGEVFLWLLPDADSESGYQLRVIPREWVQKQIYASNYAPTSLIVSANGMSKIKLMKDEFIPLRMYSPGNPGGSQSPISALKQTLSEQIQADKFRTEVWSSSGRFNAYITRPKDVAPWDDEQRKKFATAFREAWGKGGENAGKMPLLEDGMEIKPYQFNAQQAQFAETKQLSREDVAAAYHINPSLIWHTTTQTYASAKDNARALYADCLGPILQMIQQRFNSFLLPMIGADPNSYVEFDLEEKLKGSFEERASILQSAVGGPWMTRNEARADNNLPPIEGGDELIVPLNVVEGGQAGANDTHMDPQEPMTVVESDEDNESGESGEKDGTVEIKAKEARIRVGSTKDEDERMAEVLSKFFKRQGNAVIPKIGSGSDNWWNQERWDRELADELEPLIDETADAHGQEIAKALGSKYNTEQTRKYLRLVAEGKAAAINENTRKEFEEAIRKAEEDAKAEEDTEKSKKAKGTLKELILAYCLKVVKNREGERSKTLAHALVLAAACWAAIHEAPEQAKQQGLNVSIQKTWVTGENPRDTHAALNGETVGIDDKFSNGADWPGDDSLDADETCGCNCSVSVEIAF